MKTVRRSFPFLLTVIITGIVSAGTVMGQSILQISTIEKARETPVLLLFNTVNGSQTSDTFVRKAGFTFALTPDYVRVPTLALVKHGDRTLRELLLIPGLQIQLNIETDGNSAFERGTGPWQLFDSIFRKYFGIEIPRFKTQALKESAAQRLSAYSSMLKRIDDSIPFTYRPVKDWLLHWLMRQATDSSENILQLNDYQSIYKSYLNGLFYPTLKGDIDSRYKLKLNSLVALQEGKPVPLFALRDSAGKMHRLQDHLGKVIYLDMWASWCLPCRLETPYLQRIVDRYRSRADIIFIGIAVSDKVREWKKAITTDHPRWLQLHDTNTFAANAFAVSSVPRYVLIGKDGNVLNFYAPQPSDTGKLIEILDNALKD